MEGLYQVIGIKRQGFFELRKRHNERLEMEAQLHYMIYKIREDHPEIGVREMYFKIHPEGIGRDAFEEFCRVFGYMCERKINYTVTTDSRGVQRFPNHMAEMEHLVESPNQLWQSDICYFEVAGRFNYITLIQDCFSKIIVGHSAAVSLTTEATTLPALKMAIRRNKKYGLKGLVLHSDGGGQYYDKAFVNLTGRYKLVNSMCEYPWENGMAESLNNVIKNKYLRYRNITNLRGLQQELDNTVSLYNNDKPHSSLKRMTPVEFEKKWVNLVCQKNATETESFDAKVRKKGTSNPFLPSQMNAPGRDVISAK